MKNFLKTSVIYQVYVRNFTQEGTFKALVKKLDYIKSLNVDIVYVLPVSPIGKVSRKGELGSPYSISDYTKINPELGNLDDFKELIKETHARDMKLMVDMVLFYDFFVVQYDLPPLTHQIPFLCLHGDLTL